MLRKLKEDTSLLGIQKLTTDTYYFQIHSTSPLYLLSTF